MILSEQNLQRAEKAFGYLGMAIVAWMVYRLGPRRIAENLHMVNWGIFLMIALKGARFLAQALSWKLLLGEQRRGVSFRRLLRVALEGEALNYITITRVGGEAVKAYALKPQIPLSISAASVIVLKFTHLMGFWIVLTIGFLMVHFSDLSGGVKAAAGLGIGALAAFLIFLYWIQNIGMFRPVAWMLGKVQSKRAWIDEQALRLTRLNNQILETYRSRPGRIILSIVIQALGWVEEIVFIWLTFLFLKLPQDWLLPTLVTTLALLLNSLFFFVPWRAGTQEGTLVLVFTMLDLSEPMGLSVAILKRVSELFWVFLGLAFFALETVQAPDAPAVEKLA